MLPLLFITIFLAAGVTANKVAGKYQVLFFYQLYRLEVEAFGLEVSRMAPGCAKNGVVCDMEAFMKEICIIDRKPKFGADKKPIMIPNTNRPEIFDYPDLNKVDWARIGEGADLDVFATEFDKSGFMGKLENAKIFKGWNQESTFKNVMTEAEVIGTKAIAQLKKDGKPADDRSNKMIAALKTHADARRYDQAQNILEGFSKYMGGKRFTIVYTDPIERPPVPGYRKIDVDRTISDNQGRAGFNKVEEVVKNFVTKENSAKISLSHVQAIVKTDEIHEHLAEACKA
ncbi:uncharacterized protein TRUGW13939_01138 [Talaromyces rugulosus]|uniref:Uncharacterized protein n=1 Tax=Talaromyces rugulosus TaxID=121627 RepID=A0A7H8QKP7_TALRU|nr:uncharacterized protein TRUGW13939_01138 [Talaromyces rugulosus]QKX54055.1 hypothetical protein TRUGW13939_01138 [Talaromyces rugulosus]